MTRRRDLAIAILNGLVGGRLHRAHHPLATAMSLYLDGRAIPRTPAAIAAAYPTARPRVVVLVHGLMGTEHHFEYADGDGTTDYGRELARDLDVSAVYVRYNSGQAVAVSGAQLSALLAGLVAAWPVPVEELVLVGHSMGGLVIANACSDEAPWVSLVRRAFYLGAPLEGSPLARAGRMVAGALRVDPRSDGVRDLGAGRRAPALRPSIRHHYVAGSVSERTFLAEAIGDTLVPVSSATRGAFASDRVAVLVGVSHNLLARHPRVYERLRTWMREGG